MSTTATVSEELLVTQLVEQLLSEYPPSSTDALSFLGAQFDLGLAWVQFPVGHGGLGLSPRYQKIVN